MGDTNKAPPPAYSGNPPPPANYGAPPPQGQQQYGAPPPQYSGGQQQSQYSGGQQSSTTVVMMGGGPSVLYFGDMPMHCTCPHCRAQIVTRLEFEVGGFAWLMCVILCLVGCNLGCCLIPFCVDGAKDAKHYCPNCQQYLGGKSRM